MLAAASPGAAGGFAVAVLRAEAAAVGAAAVGSCVTDGSGVGAGEALILAREGRRGRLSGPQAATRSNVASMSAPARAAV